MMASTKIMYYYFHIVKKSSNTNNVNVSIGVLTRGDLYYLFVILPDISIYLLTKALPKDI